MAILIQSVIRLWRTFRIYPRVKVATFCIFEELRGEIFSLGAWVGFSVWLCLLSLPERFPRNWDSCPHLILDPSLFRGLLFKWMMVPACKKDNMQQKERKLITSACFFAAKSQSFLRHLQGWAWSALPPSSTLLFLGVSSRYCVATEKGDPAIFAHDDFSVSVTSNRGHRYTVSPPLLASVMRLRFAILLDLGPPRRTVFTVLT